METQNNTPAQSDETKIYTPRYSVQVKTAESAFQSLYDQAPVRIYEKPIKNSNVSDKFSVY